MPERVPKPESHAARAGAHTAPSLLERALGRVAHAVCRRPVPVLVLLALVGALAGLAASGLTINSNQLDLIDQNLREVHDVKRVIDMVGGSGHLMLALRSDDEAAMKATADDLAAMLQADTEHVRTITHRMPVEFVQRNIGLFVETQDLQAARTRIGQYVKAMARRNNPFFVRLRDDAPEPKLQMDDIVAKYSHVGKKTILDEYYISQDRKMVLLLIKPNWDTNELGRTHAFVTGLRAKLAAYRGGPGHDVALIEDYARVGDAHTIAYGFTGAYKTSLDDSFAIEDSLGPVSLWAFAGIVLITIAFFRRLAPCLIVMSGMVLGTVLTMGFCRISVGQLNMITSILGGILMGFGVDYGIHFIFRTRIELGAGRTTQDAVAAALIKAGRPATVAAIVTGGSFAVLMVSRFRGFSQFGFLAGIGTLIMGATMFLWSAAWVAYLGRLGDARVRQLIGTMAPPQGSVSGGGSGPAARVPRPRLLLGACGIVVAIISVLAVPRAEVSALPGSGEAGMSWHDALLGGVRFNYNSRALMAPSQTSIVLQDEIGRRFNISSDPVAVYTPNLEEARALFDALTVHPERYPTIDQVMSIWSFVPEPQRAARNHAIMQAWGAELDALDVNLLSEEARPSFDKLRAALRAEPFDVHGVPAIYADQFRNLPQARPENVGYLTFIYPRVDLYDGQQMLRFADEVGTIRDDAGHAWHAAGSPLLMAQLARMVLFDGRLTLVLAAVWILVLHYLDFRSVALAVASVLPLGLGLSTMLGLMAVSGHPLNFMNIIMLPILLGFGVSHGLYLLHRFLEGVPAATALRSVGAAVASSTLTAVAGFASLLAARHQGLQSMGYVAVLGLLTTLGASFSVLAAVLQIIDDRRHSKARLAP